ncbi:UNKNOWN [Stylonychia lemnae]|uniref:Uncharacterized protein n=1 Tax=Stylonychia lemnae TaxID=5949 RepID=A0A078B1U3_STYLE|nr:UNKNOWN [Stylonychia lemnae]|eukprot:CDW87278.1 UNKNOWN [Stylonychia lemnae]
MSFFDSSSRFQSNKSGNTLSNQLAKALGNPSVATYNITIPVQSKNPSISSKHQSPNFTQDYRVQPAQGTYNHDKMSNKRLSAEPLTIEELQKRLNVKSTQMKRPSSRTSLVTSPTSYLQQTQEIQTTKQCLDGCQIDRDVGSLRNDGHDSRRGVEDENEMSNLGACQECFQETLSRIQSERMIITREINLNIKNIKQKENIKTQLIEKNQKKILMRRNSQDQLGSATERSLNSTCNSNKSFNIMDQQYFKKLIKNISLKESIIFQQQLTQQSIITQQQAQNLNPSDNLERKPAIIQTKKTIRQPIVTQINLPIKPKTSLNSPLQEKKQKQNLTSRCQVDGITIKQSSFNKEDEKSNKSHEKSKSIIVIDQTQNITLQSNSGSGASIIEEAKNFGKINKPNGKNKNRNQRLSMGELSRGGGNSVVQSYKQAGNSQSNIGSKSSRTHLQTQRQRQENIKQKNKQNLPSNQSSSIMTTMETTMRTMSTLNKSQSQVQIQVQKNQKENQNPKAGLKQSIVMPKMGSQNQNQPIQVSNRHIRTKSGIVLSSVHIDSNIESEGNKTKDSIQTNLYEKIYKKLDSAQNNTISTINNIDTTKKKIIQIETNYIQQNDENDLIYQNDSLNLLSNRSNFDNENQRDFLSNYSQVNLNTSDQIIQQSFNMINQDLQQYSSSILESQSPIYNNSQQEEISNQLKERLIKGLESCYICLTDEDEQAIASLRDIEKESDKSKIQTRNNKDSYLYDEEIHTCSSDEQLKTGEVTLENPQFNMTQNISKLSGSDQEHENNMKRELYQFVKHPVVMPMISKQDCNRLYGPGSFYYQPFNNISNIRETEQEDDYSVEYV